MGAPQQSPEMNMVLMHLNLVIDVKCTSYWCLLDNTCIHWCTSVYLKTEGAGSADLISLLL